MSHSTSADLPALQQAAEETWIREFLDGPTRTRLTELPPQADDAAPDLELPDSTGALRRLSEFWADGPLHLVFMRQFGCGCLADRWEQLEPAQERIAEAGATLVAVCQADPARASVVAARRGYTFPLLCDPGLGAYADYGLPEGVPATITQDFPWEPGDTATAEKWTASRRGTERALVDHMWQLPGEFVIARGGRIALAHRAQYCEDFPLTEVVLGAIAAARAQAGLRRG
jgi:peroxiredoxin